MNTTAAGYGNEHQRERKRWKQRLNTTGTWTCAKCGQPVTPDQQWDLGHTDDRKAWTGPEHTKCNRAAGGTNGARKTNTKRQPTKRKW